MKIVFLHLSHLFKIEKYITSILKIIEVRKISCLYATGGKIVGKATLSEKKICEYY